MKIEDYIHDNFHITTWGALRTQTPHNSMLEVGANGIMFSTVLPFKNISHAAEWFENAPISETGRLKIGRTNDMRMIGLDLD